MRTTPDYDTIREMSKVESQTDDAKKLALRCKTLELQLRQSVSKKDHHEVTTKLERQIDVLERDLDRARAENQKTIALNKQIAGVEGLITSLTKTANAQGKTLDFIEEEASTRGKAQTSQGKVLDVIAAKLAQGTIPSHVHLQALSKIRDLEEDKRNMVRRFEYNSLEARCGELSRQVSTMVPASDYAALKDRLDDVTKQMANMVPASDYSSLKHQAEELEGAVSSMVPREQLVSSESRVTELEARLAEHVPQTIYDELVSKVVSLAEAITGGAIQPDETRAEPQAEAAEPEATTQAVAEVEATAEAISQPIPDAPEASPEVQVTVTEPSPEVEASIPAEPAAPVIAESPVPVPEIREIQSNLAEINSQSLEAKGADVVPAAQVTEPKAFAFSGTDIVVSTGAEFLQAIANVPADVLESHVRSGDIENWFATTLADESTADAFRKIREFGATGEDLRIQAASAAAKYVVATTPTQTVDDSIDEAVEEPPTTN
jgi:hypothetical protein